MLFTLSGIYSRTKLANFHSLFPCPHCITFTYTEWLWNSRYLCNNDLWLNTPTILFWIWTGITRAWMWPTFLFKLCFPRPLNSICKSCLSSLHCSRHTYFLSKWLQKPTYFMHILKYKVLVPNKVKGESPTESHDSRVKRALRHLENPTSNICLPLPCPKSQIGCGSLRNRGQIFQLPDLSFNYLTYLLTTGAGETEWSEDKTPHTEQSENVMFQHNRDMCHSITNSPAQRPSPRQMPQQQSKVRVPEGKPVKN